MTYAEFKKMHIDLGALGAEGGRNAVRYTCTPRGAEIFGWAGVDGIHFCTVKGYGETVFSVSPMNPGRSCVQPLARDMGDFLRLLLACGDTAALEQAYMWDEEQFNAFLRENAPTEEQRAVMEEIAARCDLTPMERPWQYLKTVREETDLSHLRFEKEYEELLRPTEQKPQEWAVYFEGGFGAKRPRRRPGKETRTEKEFCWDGEEWLLPAVYRCGEGLVIDLLKRVPEERLRRFREKWGLDDNCEPCRELTPAEQEQLEAENPMNEDFRAVVAADGRLLRCSTGYGEYWYPDGGAACDGEAAAVVAHYGLEGDCGWVIWRLNFPWGGKALQPKALELTLTAQKRAMCAEAFTAKPGETVPLTDPQTGERYKLTVLAVTPKTMEELPLPAGREYPKEYVELRYTVEPPAAGRLTLRDTQPGDEARYCAAGDVSVAPAAQGSACIGIIGGADGPTAVFVSGKGDGADGEGLAAYSSVHYEPVKTVTWQARFMVSPKESLTVRVELESVLTNEQKKYPA